MKLPDDIPTLQAELEKARTKTWNQKREIKRLNAKLAAFRGQLRERYNPDYKTSPERYAELKHDMDKARGRAAAAEAQARRLEIDNDRLRGLLKDDAAFKLMVELRQAQKRIAELEKRQMPESDEVGFWQANVTWCERMLQQWPDHERDGLGFLSQQGALEHARENLQRALAERGDSQVPETPGS